MIPSSDTVFSKINSGFQFYNYVSLAAGIQASWQSNCWQWNIDQVYLNYGRNLHDTIHPEIRFIYRASFAEELPVDAPIPNSATILLTK